MASKKLNILVISAEVAPFAKVGGLADVAGALPKALKAQGHDVRVVMPCYKMIETNPDYAVTNVFKPFPIPVTSQTTELAYVKQTHIRMGQGKARPNTETDDIPVYLIGNKRTPARSGFFQEATESKKVYACTPEPYVFFCRAVLEMVRRLAPDWIPDVLHCNDWQSGLVPVYQKVFYKDEPAIHNAGTVFTIHNLAYQGDFPRDKWYVNGLPESLFNCRGLECYNQWTFMKGALLFADRVNTVSANYAEEIQTPAYGCGLDGLMRGLKSEGKLSGILNGIDWEVFDPSNDPRIPCHFTKAEPAGKVYCKAILQRELGLPQARDAAMIGIVSRLADQKGLDLIHNITDRMLELPVQFVLLGTGDPYYENFFRDLEKRYPKQVRARIMFNADLAQRIYAGSDLFLMPSRFEPCGLGQMISLRYGTIPIVRATGGLADTVADFSPDTTPDGNGFSFDDYSDQTLLETVTRAVNAYGRPDVWKQLTQRALRYDSSWKRSGDRYARLFKEAIQAHKSKS